MKYESVYFFKLGIKRGISKVYMMDITCEFKFWMCDFLFSSFTQTVEHGFPNQPSALAYDPKLQLMAIGTKSGAIKVYPFVSVFLK